ncbi:MAG: hypothetical protein A4E62_03060 [Syntrophorhabdus sp. PtaU1.Bin002]|nr:MAG: hypothetical protein A4E62_03060 [Syntrophorhabdus sp. PtaU1.Bin002]
MVPVPTASLFCPKHTVFSTEFLRVKSLHTQKPENIFLLKYERTFPFIMSMVNPGGLWEPIEDRLFTHRGNGFSGNAQRVLFDVTGLPVGELIHRREDFYEE